MAPKIKTKTHSTKKRKMMKIFLFLLLPLFIFGGISEAKKCNIIAAPRYTIHISNEIPNAQITVHCRSKEDDLGTHSLKEHDDYMWQFCQNVWGTTLFACDVKWNDKTASFHGFDRKLGQDDCVKMACRWSAMADGIYFHEKKKSVKRYNWTTPHEENFHF